MKKISLCSLVSVAVALSVSACVYTYNEKKVEVNSHKDTTIHIKGSTTVHPLMDKLAQYYSLDTSSLKVAISGSGSAEGFNSLLKDSTDLAMASNKISADTRAEFRKNKIEYVEYLLAGDALVFIVNVHNNVKNLTHAQLVDIFTGKIINWKQVGGKNLPIKVLSRDQKSGTFSFFKEMILVHNPLTSKAQIIQDNGHILATITSDESAISYTNFSTLDYSVDPVSVSFDDKKTTYIAPRVESVKNLSYKYYRGLYLYYRPEKFQKIQSFMKMIHTDSTQKLIARIGFIPINQGLMMK